MEWINETVLQKKIVAENANLKKSADYRKLKAKIVELEDKLGLNSSLRDIYRKKAKKKSDKKPGRT